MGTNAKQFPRAVRQVLLIIAIVLGTIGLIRGFVWWVTRPHLISAEFVAKDGARHAFDLELRHTCAGRQEGLMFRRASEFPKRRGMLFSFPTVQVQRFWMKNTLIPLDMVFLDKNFAVVGVLAEVPPLNETPRFIEEPSQYVIEFNAGVAREVGLVRGSKLLIDEPLPRPEDC